MGQQKHLDLLTALGSKEAGEIVSRVFHLPENDRRFRLDFPNGDAAFGFWKLELESAGPSGAGSTGPVVIEFIDQKGKKDKETHEKAFTQMPTLVQIVETVEQVFKHFSCEAFELKMGKTSISSEETWVEMARSKIATNSPIHIAVTSLRRPFSSFTLQEGLNLLGITSTKNLKLLCGVDDLDLNKVLPKRISTSTGFKTAQDVMDHLGRDLAARAYICKPLDNAKEERCRELVSPVLVAAVILASVGNSDDIEMHAEISVNGVHANGSIDWVMVYKQLNVVVIEAKWANKWEEYVGQLAAEIMGSREEYALKVLGKRKSEAVAAMSQVSSWGIITNGMGYKFYKYVDPDIGGKRALLQSSTQALLITQGTTADDARDIAQPVVAIVKHILEEQMACADSISAPKHVRIS